MTRLPPDGKPDETPKPKKVLEHHVTVRVWARKKPKRRVTVTIRCSCTARGRFVSVQQNAKGDYNSDFDVQREGRVSRCPALVMILRQHSPGVSRERAERALDHGESSTSYS